MAPPQKGYLHHPIIFHHKSPYWTVNSYHVWSYPWKTTVKITDSLCAILSTGGYKFLSFEGCTIRVHGHRWPLNHGSFVGTPPFHSDIGWFFTEKNTWKPPGRPPGDLHGGTAQNDTHGVDQHLRGYPRTLWSKLRWLPLAGSPSSSQRMVFPKWVRGSVRKWIWMMIVWGSVRELFGPPLKCSHVPARYVWFPEGVTTWMGSILEIGFKTNEMR